MTTALIVVCIVFSVGIVAAIVGHMAVGIEGDKRWRSRIRRHHATRRARRGNL